MKIAGIPAGALVPCRRRPLSVLVSSLSGARQTSVRRWSFRLRPPPDLEPAPPVVPPARGQPRQPPKLRHCPPPEPLAGLGFDRHRDLMVVIVPGHAPHDRTAALVPASLPHGALAPAGASTAHISARRSRGLAPAVKIAARMWRELIERPRWAAGAARRTRRGAARSA